MTFLLTFDGVLEKYSYGISSIAASDASVRVAGQAQRDPPDERRALRGSPRFREQVAHPSRPLRPGIESICLLARPPPPRRARLIEQPQVLPPRSAAVRARARTAPVHQVRPARRPPRRAVPLDPPRYFEARAVDAVLRENLARAFVIDATVRSP